MKKWIWTIVAVVIIAVVGGVAFTSHHITQKAYTAAMTTGKKAVAKENYSVAESSFQEALRHRTNDQQAQGYLTQTQNFVAAESAMNDSEFATAKSNYTKVKNASPSIASLTNRAKTALKNLKTITVKAELFQQIYDQAVTQNQGQQYTESNATLDRIFKDSEAQQSYYTKIYNQAVDLRTANNKAIKNGGDGTSAATSSSSTGTTTNSGSSTTSANPGSSSSSSVTGLTDAEKQAAKNYKGSNEYTVPKSRTEIDGQTITAAQINSARNTLKSIGVAPGSFSDQDIRDGMIAAHKQGISFKSYAEKNYK
ncbi:hypothetical protein [Secundilactobacillus folii]|uniref:Uncharacterized protein n=1 Tax=Secundilactobacillus folii TaxID=2678357 RepID=A0A7X2XXN8_9LACO|nr:hypothetical protein [Secundilactobacillus folii]MTV82236.1 hypothetical protein [Secundilactobacillus folii]